MIKLKLSFIDDVSVLEVILLSSEISNLVSKLSFLNIKLLNSLLIKGNNYFIFNAKLYENDGSFISKERAIEVLKIISSDICV